ncbi:MAG TPA: tRNA (N(6)-L-threonylcarbamoyladenosine(37)-C(2))-methylthiotransferase MtaB [Firmicutes bacterium]|nr:tRNA (N(6)-L-threonylcarbamoyladenosine(37)-C(2))-methylthiotransferase MtaB [Bacillota bacterium]
MKVAFYTLGCKVNQYDSRALEELFRREGYETVSFKDKADVYVINTCTVTGQSAGKSRRAVRRAVGANPDAVVAVVGCYSQVAPEEIAAIPGVDIIVGTRERSVLPQLVAAARAKKAMINTVAPGDKPDEEFEELPWPEEAGRVRAFLKIQEGCRDYCSYCIVPYARGKLKSMPPARVLKYTAAIAQKGYKEMVLTGTHLGAYGKDLSPSYNLARLLDEIARNPCPERIRLSSLEPVDVTGELLAAFETLPVLCHHLHIPLQSGSDFILKKMKRPYSLKEFSSLVDSIRQIDPDMALSTDIIAGFPGEQDSHFRETCAYIEATGFSRLHVFKYSPRKGTPAAGYPGQVPGDVKEERSRYLRFLGDKLAAAYAARFVGRKLSVLVEKTLPAGGMEGLTEQYLRANLETAALKPGMIVPATIVASKGSRLFGKL